MKRDSFSNKTGKLPIGTLLGSFVIDRAISSGSYGSVYEGHHQDNKYKAAIKIVRN